MQAVLNSSTAMQAVANSSTAMTAVAASPTAMNTIVNSSTALQIVANSSTAMQVIASNARILYTICKSQAASLAIKNGLQNKKIRDIIFNTLNNDTQYFTKTDTHWYQYHDTANRVIKVVTDEYSIVIPNKMTAHYNMIHGGCLYYGADKTLIKEITNMRDGDEKVIDDTVSFKGMFFEAKGMVKVFASVFIAK